MGTGGLGRRGLVNKRRAVLGVAVGVVVAVIATASVPAFAQGSTPSNTTVMADNNPAVSGQEVTFTATVTGSGGTPTGMVEFQSDGSDISGCSAVDLDGSAMAQCQVPSGFPDGSYSISAIYSGDETFAGSSGNLTETVNQASDTTVMTSSANPSVSGETVTYQATVSANAPGSGTPTGSVTYFFYGSNPAPTCAGGNVQSLTSGVANCVVTLTPANTVNNQIGVLVQYYGDSNFKGISESSLTQTVNADPTVTTDVSFPKHPTNGEAVTFTATVTADAPGTGTPAGSVKFKVRGHDGSKVRCDAGNSTTLSGGVATCSVSGGLSLSSSPYTVT